MTYPRPVTLTTSDPEDAPWTRLDWVYLGAVLVVATVASFWGIGREALWLDEATTYFRSSKPIDGVVRDAIGHFHVPTYFVLVHYWMALGDSEAMLRAPSAVLAIASVGMCFLLGRVAGGRATGLIAALLLGLSRFQISFAQEARMYALLVFATTTSMTGALWLFRHPNTASLSLLTRAANGSLARGPAFRWWMLCLAGLVLALYTHNAATFFAATLAITAIAVSVAHRQLRWKLITNWVIGGVIVSLLYAPWLGTLLTQTAEAEDVAWGKARTVATVLHYAGGMFSMPGDYPIMAGLGVALVTIALITTWTRERRTSLSLVAFSLMPIAMVLIVSIQRPMFQPRILIGCTPSAHVLLALGVAALPLPLFSAAAGSLLLCALQLLPAHYADLRKEDWPRALRFIDAHWKEGALLLSVGGRETRQIRYYYDRKSDPFPKHEFYGVTPRNVASRIKRAKPTVIFTISLRRRSAAAAPVLAEIHKDWRTVKRVRYRRVLVTQVTKRRHARARDGR